MPATATVSGRLEIDFSVYNPSAMAFIENPFPVLDLITTGPSNRT